MLVCVAVVRVMLVSVLACCDLFSCQTERKGKEGGGEREREWGERDVEREKETEEQTET